VNTVLVVDDSALHLKIYDRMLRDIPDARSVTFESSARALDWCSTNEPDLLVVDYQMPAPDGLEFIERFRTRYSQANVPVVMITADDAIAVRHKALEFGATDFLNKPVDPIEFRARISNILRVRTNTKELSVRVKSLADQVQEASAAIVASETDAIYRLARASEHLDAETSRHIERIGQFAARVALEFGTPSEWQELLRLAAPMHDIGKVGTPDDVLQKKGSLTPEEWEVMRSHTIAGYDILRDSPSPIMQMAAEIALAHHERFDGTGYPFGLAGEQIPLSARITALCDVFDALLSRRPYKAPWPLEKVVQYVDEQAGRHFDPDVVVAFRACLPDLLAMRDASEAGS